MLYGFKTTRERGQGRPAAAGAQEIRDALRTVNSSLSLLSQRVGGHLKLRGVVLHPAAGRRADVLLSFSGTSARMAEVCADYPDAELDLIAGLPAPHRGGRPCRRGAARRGLTLIGRRPAGP